jgi:predicted nucleotidyltransferase component of viral defense system
LELINQNKEITKNFYWTGGTVLSEFYLHHRLSEDIDLFCENEEVNQEVVEVFLKKSQSRLSFKSIKRTQFLGLFSYHLIYIKGSLKVDFSYYPFPRIEKGLKYKNIEIDSLHDIAVNKVHTIAIKPRARDFIDIYFIIKEKKYSFEKLLMDAKVKFDWHIDPIELGSQLLRARDLKDYPKMIKKIDHQDFQQFFLKEAGKLKNKILK